MRIGIDARSLSKPITGIGRYTLELLDRMVLNNEHEWFIYSNRPLLNGNWDYPNVVVRNWNISNRWLGMGWYQTILPLQVAKDKCDLFWSPAHYLPNFLPKSINTVVTIHDLVWKHAPETMRPLSKKLDSWLMPKAMQDSDAIISVSQWTADDVVREIPEALEKVFVIHEAPSSIESMAPKDDVLKDKYLLFVGTLEPRKNLPRLFEAYSKLSSELRKSFSLKVVGGNGWEGEMMVPDGVEIMGYVTDAELDELYRGASLLLMPSLYEGFGLPIIEAMSRGIPVLTSNISSMPEVAGDAAIYVDPYSVESITAGLNEVLSSPALRNTLSKQGLKRATKFSWNEAVKQTLKVFEFTISK